MTDSNSPNEQAPPRSLAHPQGAGLPAHDMQIEDWAAMGKAFEGMCKAGLALTVGFSVAAAFCKMMDAKNVDIPGMVNKLAGSVFHTEEPPAEKPR